MQRRSARPRPQAFTIQYRTPDVYPSRCDPVQSHGVPLEKHLCKTICVSRALVQTFRHTWQQGPQRTANSHRGMASETYQKPSRPGSSIWKALAQRLSRSSQGRGFDPSETRGLTLAPYPLPPCLDREGSIHLSSQHSRDPHENVSTTRVLLNSVFAI
jgi:hypothetical protein